MYKRIDVGKDVGEKDLSDLMLGDYVADKPGSQSLTQPVVNGN